MKFSVIIPVYNIETYIVPCLDSIVRQSFTDYEIILVNDGSIDSSRVICERYVNKYDNIILINKENGGPSSARKAAINIAKGEYIVCVDGDDYICDSLFERLNECINNSPEVDIVCYGYNRVNDETLTNTVYNSLPAGTYLELEEIRQRFLYDTTQKNENTGVLIFSLWSKAIKRELFIKSQYAVNDSIKNGEDTLLSAYALSMAKSLIVLDYAGYNYRDNPSSMTRIRKPEDLANISRVKDELEKMSIYPIINIAHYYIYSIYILVTDIAAQVNNYKSFYSLLSNLDVDSKYYHIKPYGKCLRMKYRIKYFLIQNRLWWLVYLISKVHR